PSIRPLQVTPPCRPTITGFPSLDSSQVAQLTILRNAPHPQSVILELGKKSSDKFINGSRRMISQCSGFMAPRVPESPRSPKPWQRDMPNDAGSLEAFLFHALLQVATTENTSSRPS